MKEGQMIRRNWLHSIVALLSCASSPASAQSFHVHLQELGPLPAEAFSPLDGQRQDNHFGSDVVIRNGLAFIGMPATMTTGIVAEFTQSTSGWTRTATIVASDRTTGDGFGQAISFRDGLLVVGSERAVYIYKRVNGVWYEKQKIVPPAADGLNVVRELKHEAGVLAFAAFSSSDFRHALYVYEQDANGRFVRRARLMTSDADGFPWSIDMTKAIIVVGTQGTAYIFGRNTSGQWMKRQKLIASSRTNAHDGYGRVVAVDNHMILVSAPEAPTHGDSTGEVHVFLPGATQYVEAFKLPLPGGTGFGSAIAISDKYIAVGGADIPFTESNPPGFVSTYLREGSTVRPLGAIDIHDTGDTRETVAKRPTSIDIANNLLLVGSAFDHSCFIFDDFCEPNDISIGEANLFRLNQFKQ
jgi:hypothetical protein